MKLDLAGALFAAGELFAVEVDQTDILGLQRAFAMPRRRA
jgi:hypothetical protein